MGNPIKGTPGTTVYVPKNRAAGTGGYMVYIPKRPPVCSVCTPGSRSASGKP